jgi:hypothetical protein
MIAAPPKASAQGKGNKVNTPANTPAGSGSGGGATSQAPPAEAGGGCGPFQTACNAAGEFRGPGTALVGGLSGLGLLVGGSLVGIGQQTGVRIMAVSAAAGGGIMIGNGVISVLT